MRLLFQLLGMVEVSNGELLRTVLTDKKTSDSRWCDFSDIERDHRYKHGCKQPVSKADIVGAFCQSPCVLTSSEPSDESSSDEHADMHRACLQSTTDNVYDRGNDQSFFSTIRVAVPPSEDRTEESSSSEKSENRSDDFVRVIVQFCVRRIRRQPHGCVEGWLSNGERGNAEVESVTYATKT
jgi:hypothetical protein